MLLLYSVFIISQQNGTITNRSDDINTRSEGYLTLSLITFLCHSDISDKACKVREKVTVEIVVFVMSWTNYGKTMEMLMFAFRSDWHTEFCFFGVQAQSVE